MAENKKSFILYADLLHTVRKLPKSKAGELFLTILEYVNDENPNTDKMDLLVQVAFEPIKRQLKRDLKDWEEIRQKRSDAGKLGMEKRWGKDNKGITNITKDNGVKSDITKITVNDTVTVNDNDTVNNINNGVPFNIALDEYEYCQNLVDAKKEWDYLDTTEQNKVFEHIKSYIKNHEENDKRRYLPDFSKYLKEQRYKAKQLPYKSKKLTAGDSQYKELK